jgi:uncharacterized protein (TIGR03437 family)
MSYDGSTVAGSRPFQNNFVWSQVLVAQAGFSGSKHFQFHNIMANVPASQPQIEVAIQISGQQALIRLPVAIVVSPIVVTTNPPGLTITVDTQPYTSPQTFQWHPGSQHTIGTPSPQISTGTRQLFANWSDSGAQTHIVTTPAGSQTYTASFNTQYALSLSSSPSAGGTVAANPNTLDGYYAAGTSVQLTALPSSARIFTNWSGDLLGAINPQSVTMSAPRAVTAFFNQAPNPLVLNCTTAAGPTQASIAYNATCTASGGNFPYTFSTTGVLPSGLNMNTTSTTASISGLPSVAGPYSYAVRVTDSSSASAQQSYSGNIGVANTPNLSVSPANLTLTGYQGRINSLAQTLSLTSTDGSPVNFNIANLPFWVSVSPVNGTANASPKTITVTPNTSNLPVGLTSGVITIASANAPAVLVNVQANISPFSISASGSLVEFIASGMTKSGTLAVTTVDNAPALLQASAATTGGDWLRLLSSNLSAPGSISYVIDATNLNAGNYNGMLTLICAPVNPCAAVPVGISLTVSQSKPVITEVVNTAGGALTISQNTWIEIKGTDLSLTTRTWKASDFDPQTGLMPTKLDGVSVTVNGKAAFVYYVSPTQINVLTPVDPALGSVPIIVTSPLGTGATTNAVLLENSLGFFTFNSDKYAAATHANGSLLGPPSLYPGLTTPAQPGETIVIYGNGFGQTNPPLAPGFAVQLGLLPANPVITIGGLSAVVKFAGVVAPGLYQFNVVVPPAAPDGDLPISATYNSFTTHSGVFVTIKH